MGVGGQGHAPAALPPGRRPGTHCTGGWINLLVYKLTTKLYMVH
jgi:hypothetical protein